MREAANYQSLKSSNRKPKGSLAVWEEFELFRQMVALEPFEWVQHLIVVALLGLIPAVIAVKKGRSFVVWWLFGSALLIIALPAAYLVESMQGRKKCRGCGEFVHKEAARCPFCGRELK